MLKRNAIRQSLLDKDSLLYCVPLTTPASCEETDNSPGKEFKEIIGTRDEIEAIAVRNGTNTSSRRAQIAKSDMSNQIGEFGPLLSSIH